MGLLHDILFLEAPVCYTLLSCTSIKPFMLFTHLCSSTALKKKQAFILIKVIADARVYVFSVSSSWFVCFVSLKHSGFPVGASEIVT